MLFLSGIAAFVPLLRWGVLAADLVLVALVVLDLVRTGDPARIVPRRSAPERVRLAQPFARTLALEGARAGLAFELHEEQPSSFEALAGEVAAAPGACERGRFDAAGAAVLVRHYRPGRRGRFALGDLRLRVRGPQGWIERQARFRGALALAVEPALLGLSETLHLAASERWQDLGVRTLRRFGGQTEFESLREFVRGDEVRRVDWKATARRAKPMVRTYQVERGQELLLLIDAGRRMRATDGAGATAEWTKLDWALDATLQLAAVALRQGDRVGAAAFERGLVAYVPPGKGAQVQARLAGALFDLQPSEREGDLGRALRELAVRHRRRATVLVVSDVADPLSLEEQRRALASAARHQRVIFAALDDPPLRTAAEPGAGDVVLRAAALELAAERARGLRTLRRSGVRVLDALPAEAAAPMLAAWLDERRRG
ncbi:MAG TPA: DUF58 domain-containing protein [Planctomycetota bacterium]